MPFPKLPTQLLLERLAPPKGKTNMVLDTDTYNEIDDQFALVYSLLAPEKLEVEAVYAAPFTNHKTEPAEGMEKSHEEILRVLERLGRSPEGLVHKGSQGFLPGPGEALDSPAARDLIDRAMAERDGAPLYVLAIGAVTNVASAILLEPKIIERIVVVWLGGQPFHWPSAAEYNLQQDPAAARTVFDCGVPLVHIPCTGVSEMLQTTVAEMERHVKGRGPVGDYLFEIFRDYGPDTPGWSKVIWDISAPAYLIDPSWVPTELVHSPILTNELTWSFDNSRHFVRSAVTVRRDAVFADLFARLEGLAP